MYAQENAIQTNKLATLIHQAAPRVVNAIKAASAKTGVDFAYLMEKASAESSFDAKAESKTSSAAGLFQFIESTWLKMVKDHGAQFGMGQYADKISEDGKCCDAAAKEEILALRKDPETAAMMAAQFAADNRAYMERQLGGETKIGSTEMYMAHFLGAGGATAFLKEMQDNPLANAADLFPKAARANRNVFYDKETGGARTLAGIYDLFDKKFGGAGNVSPLAVSPAPAVMATAEMVEMPRPQNKPQQISMPSAATSLMMAQEMGSSQQGSLLKILETPDENKSEERRVPVNPLARATERPAQRDVTLNQAHLLVMAQLAAPVTARRYND